MTVNSNAIVMYSGSANIKNMSQSENLKRALNTSLTFQRHMFHHLF